MEELAKKQTLPWRTRFKITLLTTVIDLSRRYNGTVNRRLLSILIPKTSPDPNPINGVKSSDVSVDPSRNLWFRLFIPTTDESQNLSSLPIIVFFHGGAFMFFSADTMMYDAVCRRFARKTPAVVVSVDYRLAPEYKYPAQFDDGFDVLKFLDDEKNRELLPENVNLSCCFVAGDSAGGNIAHHVAKRASEFRSDFKAIKVIGVVAIQPFFGGEERTEAETRLAKIEQIVSVTRTDWYWKVFLPAGEGMDRDHEVINVSSPRAVDISKLDFPTTMIVVSGFDSLQDWQRRYYEWLKKSGIEVYLTDYPTMVHAFYIFPELPESTQLILEIKDFIHKQCLKLRRIDVS